MIIEDDDPVRRILARIIKLVHAEATTAEHGMAGLKALEQNAFDLVITDLKMPGVNGLDVVQWIRKHRSPLPVIVISGFATNEDSDKIAALGARLLRKPFTPDGVHDAMRLALRAHSVPK